MATYQKRYGMSDGFGAWWAALTDAEQASIAAVVGLLEGRGPAARISAQPYRVLYAFDPRRAAILLLGGDKTGHDRRYAEFVRVADKLYDDHVASLKREGLI